MAGKLGNTLTKYGYAQAWCRPSAGAFETHSKCVSGTRSIRVSPAIDSASDPFAEQKLTRYEVTEFKATRLAVGLNLPILA
jgi:hypothetical protein